MIMITTVLIQASPPYTLPSERKREGDTPRQPEGREEGRRETHSLIISLPTLAPRLVLRC